MTKRTLALLLALLTTASLLSACTPAAGTPTTTQASTPPASTTVQADPGSMEETLDITWLGWNINNIAPVQGNSTQQYLEEKYNVRLTVANVDQFNDESWNLYWASGNTADYIILNGTEKRLFPLLNQNLLREVPEELMETYLPTWLSMTRSLVAKETELLQCSKDGKRYVVPMVDYGIDQTYIGITRKDWMEKVGITSVPATIDEFEELLRRYSEEDPDNNGKKDTVGLEPEPWNKFNYVFGAYGTGFDAYYADDDGKVFYSSASEDYKNALRKLSEWYKAGYLDKEFVTDLRPAVWSKFADGKIGVVFDHPWYFSIGVANGPGQQFSEKNPGVELVYLPAFTGPDGRSGGLAGFPSTTQNGICFGKDTSDAKIIRIMQMMEERCADRELYVRLQYGTENETYTMTDGKPALTAEASQGDKQSALGIGQYFGIIPVDTAYFKQYQMDAADDAVYSVSAANSKQYMAGACFVYNGVNQSFATSGAGINKIALEFYYNAITGAVDVDAQWDSYIANLNAAGLQAVVDEYNQLIVH